MNPLQQLAVVYLASPREHFYGTHGITGSKWMRIDFLKASLQMLRKHVFPWVDCKVFVFHEDFQESDMASLRSLVGECDIEFPKVDFKGKESVFVSGRAGRCGSYGYAMMARFWSGEVQRHEALSKFSHYMRLDDDSYIVGPFSDSVVSGIFSNDYTFRTTFSDEHLSLYEFTQDFLKRRGLPCVHSYNKEEPYTNYHTASLAMWRNPLVAEFLAEIHSQEGCLTKRWEDAAIQGMIIYALAPVCGLMVHREGGFSYRHNQHCSHDGPHTKYCLPPGGEFGPPEDFS